jgi:hypothetical protein
MPILLAGCVLAVWLRRWLARQVDRPDSAVDSAEDSDEDSADAQTGPRARPIPRTRPPRRLFDGSTVPRQVWAGLAALPCVAVALVIIVQSINAKVYAPRELDADGEPKTDALSLVADSLEGSFFALYLHMHVVPIVVLAKVLRLGDFTPRGRPAPAIDAAGPRIALFSMHLELRDKVIAWTLGAVDGVVGWVLGILSQLGICLDIFWFPGAFLSLWNAKRLVESMRVEQHTLHLHLHWVDAYLYYVHEQSLNFLTGGLFGAVCARSGYNRFLDAHIRFNAPLPPGFSPAFTVFAAKPTCVERCRIRWCTLAAYTPLCSAWLVALETIKATVTHIRLGGRSARFEPPVTYCSWLAVGVASLGGLCARVWQRFLDQRVVLSGAAEVKPLQTEVESTGAARDGGANAAALPTGPVVVYSPLAEMIEARAVVAVLSPPTSSAPAPVVVVGNPLAVMVEEGLADGRTAIQSALVAAGAAPAPALAPAPVPAPVPAPDAAPSSPPPPPPDPARERQKAIAYAALVATMAAAILLIAAIGVGATASYPGWAANGVGARREGSAATGLFTSCLYKPTLGAYKCVGLRHNEDDDAPGDISGLCSTNFGDELAELGDVSVVLAWDSACRSTDVTAAFVFFGFVTCFLQLVLTRAVAELKTRLRPHAARVVFVASLVLGVVHVVIATLAVSTWGGAVANLNRVVDGVAGSPSAKQHFAVSAGFALTLVAGAATAAAALGTALASGAVPLACGARAPPAPATLPAIVSAPVPPLAAAEVGQAATDAP